MHLSSSMITVACCQYGPRVGELEYNRQKSEALIRQAHQQGANVIVLPELAQSGFNFHDQKEAYALSETIDGKTIQGWKTLAISLDVVIVAGYCERLENEQVANSAVMIEPSGEINNYQKVHLWDNEINIFVRGDQHPPVIDTKFGRLAMMICYDIEFPEWVRIPALKGAQLLCAPVNWPDYPRPEDERPTEMIRAQANASVNKIFLAVCDRCETERGLDWVGGSIITDSDGFPLKHGFNHRNEEILIATIDLNDAKDKSISPNNDVHRDRQIDLYGKK